jgi:MSHA biogenesis protein MshQ
LVEQDRWYQVVATYNDSEMILYINGEKEYTRSASGELKPSDQQPLYIGCADPDSSRNARHFTGYIDEVQIYNRALSETEVKSLS